MEQDTNLRVRDICAYKGCENRRNSGGLKLYSFPRVDVHRCALWVENSGNKRLEELAPATLYRRGLCGDHFEPYYFRRGNFLSHKAVPRVYVEAEDTSAQTSAAPVTEAVEDLPAMAQAFKPKPKKRKGLRRKCAQCSYSVYSARIGNVPVRRLFKTPQDKDLKKKWEDALSTSLGELDCVCEMHFRDEDIEKYFQTLMPDGTIHCIKKENKTLKRNAIPIKV